MPLLVLHRSNTEPLPNLPLQTCSTRTPRRSPLSTPHSPPHSNPHSPRNGPVLPLEAVTNLQSSPSVVPRRSSHLVEAAKMATAKLKQHLHSHHGPHRLFRTNSSNLSEPPINEAERQKERDFICCYECNSGSLSASEISAPPSSKEVGTACKNLRVGDFDLLKTIGTGIFTPSRKEEENSFAPGPWRPR